VSVTGNFQIYLYILIPVTEIITQFVEDSIMKLLYRSFRNIHKKNNLASEPCLPINNRCEKERQILFELWRLLLWNIKSSSKSVTCKNNETNFPVRTQRNMFSLQVFHCQLVPFVLLSYSAEAEDKQETREEFLYFKSQNQIPD
jgi:hypothetical protein